MTHEEKIQEMFNKYHWKLMKVDELIELLQKVKPNHYVAVNEVKNLTILDLDKDVDIKDMDVGYIDTLDKIIQYWE